MLITLTTDFGLQDEYVGLVKGVLYDHAPGIRVVDLSHGVPPQNIMAAAHLIAACWRYFPQGTVHLAVVDPGVGTGRRIIILEKNGHLFVGPDNGLFSVLACDMDPQQPLYVVPERLIAEGSSKTFHGRDIMAPVAARLATGIVPEMFGEPAPVASMVRLEEALPHVSDTGIDGRIVWVDRFGTLVTNIGMEMVRQVFPQHDLGGFVLTAQGCRFHHLADTYATAPDGAFFFLIGSRDSLEIAVKNGNANRMTGIGLGQTCTLAAVAVE